MTIKAMEDFVLYSTKAGYLDDRFPYHLGTGTIDNTGGRFSGGSLTMTSSGDHFGFPALSNVNYHWYSFSFKMTSLAESIIFTTPFYAPDTTSSTTSYNIAGGLKVSATGQLQRMAWGSSTADIPGKTLEVGTWYHFEIGVRCADVDGVYIIRIDNEEVYSGGGDTLGISYPNFAMLSGGAAGNTYCDICHVEDTTALPTPLGLTTVVSLWPNGDTAQADFAGDYTDISDPIGSHDGATTTISSSTLGHKSVFTHADLTEEYASVSVYGAQVVTEAIAAEWGYRPLVQSLISGGVSANSSAYNPSAISYLPHYGDVVELDPATSTAWTKDSINSVQAAIEIVASV